jgi:streptogramin lyase
MLKTRAFLLCLATALPAVVGAQTPSPTPTPTATASPAATATPTQVATFTPTPAPNITPSGQAWTTDTSTNVTGARILPAADGSTWFLTPSNDRVIKLQGTVMTQFPLRDTNNIGANPVDLQMDGNTLWIVDNGESEVDAGKSIIARLCTATAPLDCGPNGGPAALREWVLPTSRPAGLYREPGGQKIWVAQSAGLLESLDLTTLQVVDYRLVPTVNFASTLVHGPDGGLWMTDFGSNRIIRFDPSDNSERAWTIVDPTLFHINPSDAKFDESGYLWITESAGGIVDRFDPCPSQTPSQRAAGCSGGFEDVSEVHSYLGFTNPVHLDLFGGSVYVSEQTGTNGRVTILDPRIARHSPSRSLPVQVLPFLGDQSTAGASGVIRTIRPTPSSTTCTTTLPRPSTSLCYDTTITPVNFTPTNAAFAGSDLTVASVAPGLLSISFNRTNSFGIGVLGGAIWAGSTASLVRLVAQTIGGSTDKTLPVALQFGAPPADKVRADVTLHNKGSAPVSGTAFFQYSPAAFLQTFAFDLGPGQTTLLSDAFVGAATSSSLMIGSVRFQVSTGAASDLLVSLRSNAVTGSGGSFGISLPAQTADQALKTGDSRTLFMGARPGEISVLGLFSPSGGQGTATLVASDGTVRGSQPITLESNVWQEYNPAASFFAVTPQPGDVIRIAVTSGVLQPYVTIQDPLTHDLALSLPVATSMQSVIPNAGTAGGFGGTLWASGVFLSNPDPTNTATVQATFYPLDASSSAVTETRSLPPGSSLAILDAVTDLFHAAPGQGAIVLTSDLPVAASLRASAQATPDAGQYASMIAAIDGAAAVPAGGALGIGIPNTSLRRTTLFLFNKGAPGIVQLTGYDASGNVVGHLSVSLGSNVATRVNQILPSLGAPGTSLGSVRVEAASGMQVYAETAEVDAQTSDTEYSDLH